MPQIFHPSTNTFSKVSIFGAVFFIAGAVAVLAGIFQSPYASGVNVVVEQPVQFSHEHHVSGLGIECRYCHTGVEEAVNADIPPTHTCMTCHSQIWIDSPALAPVRESYSSGESIPWNRVNDLPDFVYFNHAIHINKGVGCETCHGRVDQMQLIYKAETFFMSFCLDCHRAPQKYIRPKEAVFAMGYVPETSQAETGPQLVEQYEIASVDQLTDCTVCHR